MSIYCGEVIHFDEIFLLAPKLFEIIITYYFYHRFMKGYDIDQINEAYLPIFIAFDALPHAVQSLFFGSHTNDLIFLPQLYC